MSVLDSIMFHLSFKLCKEKHAMLRSWDICPVCLAPTCGWFIPINYSAKGNLIMVHLGNSKIGSGLNCEVRIILPGIARHHATLNATREKINKKHHYSYTIMNPLNNNEVKVNDAIINEPRSIIDGDIITLGKIDLKYKCL